MILKWLFAKHFCLKHFIVIIYCMFDNNMDDNIHSYHLKVLILEFINCKLSENGMRTVVFNNDVMVETIVLLTLLKHQFSALVGLLAINRHIMCYYAWKVSKFICLYITYTMFIVSIENGDFNDLRAMPNHLLLKLNQLCQIYMNSVYNIHKQSFK